MYLHNTHRDPSSRFSSAICLENSLFSQSKKEGEIISKNRALELTGIHSVSQSVSQSISWSFNRQILSIYYVPGIFWNHLDFLSLVISLSRREPLPRQDSGPYGDHFSLVQLTRWKWLYFYSLAQDWLSHLAPWLPEELKPNYFFLTRPIFSLVSMTCPGPGLVWNADASVLAHRKYLTNCSVDYGYTYSVSLVWVTKLYQRL